MLKKVTSPPQAWKGAYGELYPTTSLGHPIDWTTGKVNLGGYCDVGGFEGQFLNPQCEATTACTLDASSLPSVYTKSADCMPEAAMEKRNMDSGYASGRHHLFGGRLDVHAAAP